MNTGWDERGIDRFEALRPRLFGIAYRMLGQVEEAEDVVQEAWLRWQRSDTAGIRSQEAWLVAVVSRLSLDRLRRAATERAAYTGPWLPEPIATDARSLPDLHAELASDLSIAFLVLLERLAPEERIAFVLREVFDADYADIAKVLGRNEVACRQVVHRARQRVRSERPRQPVQPGQVTELLGRFLRALHEEDRGALLALLSETVTFTSDGGGKVASARNVIAGPDRVIRLLLGLQRKGRGRASHEIQTINGEPAMVTFLDGRLFGVTAVRIEDGQFVGFYRMLNPDKLRHVAIR